MSTFHQLYGRTTKNRRRMWAMKRTKCRRNRRGYETVRINAELPMFSLARAFLRVAVPQRKKKEPLPDMSVSIPDVSAMISCVFGKPRTAPRWSAWQCTLCIGSPLVGLLTFVSVLLSFPKRHVLQFPSRYIVFAISSHL